MTNIPWSTSDIHTEPCQSYIHTNTGHHWTLHHHKNNPARRHWLTQQSRGPREVSPEKSARPVLQEKCHQRNLHVQDTLRTWQKRETEAGTPNTPTDRVRLPIHWPQAEPSAHTYTHTCIRYLQRLLFGLRRRAAEDFISAWWLSAASQTGNAAVTGCQGPR